MNNNITCCFTGHRIIPVEEYDRIKRLLKEEIIKLINIGVKFYGTGGAIGFDTLAALTVLELKNDFPFIKLILVLPCHNQTDRWKKEDRDIYEFIKQKSDKYVYVSDKYYDGCMLKRNIHLVNNSKYCICYLSSHTGGTAFTVNYAKKMNLTIINLYKLL